MKKFFVLLGIIACLIANTNVGQQSNREFEKKTHDINQVELEITNYGKFGPAWWPKGSGHMYIFGAGFWFGAIDSVTGDTLVTIGYGPHGGESECVPGLQGMPLGSIIYMYPSPWPPPADTYPMAPQDRVSHQDSWCCYNDCDSTYHMPGDTRPIGIEVYQTVYAWDEPGIEDAIFFTLEFKNVSEYNLKNCYIGICADCDIGNEAGGNANDICTVILEKPYFIGDNLYIIDDLAYQWQEVEEPGWPEAAGAIGFDLLQTPFDLQTGEDKDDDGIPDQYERDSVYYWNNVPQHKWDVDNDGVPDWRDASENPQLGMTAFKRFTLILEPNIDPERYMTLAGYNFTTGEYEPYDTLGLPDPDDQRYLISSGPFDLDKDSIMTFVFAIVLADYGDDAVPQAETCLVLTDHRAQVQYNMNWLLSVEEKFSVQPISIDIMLCPNPVIRRGFITFSLRQSGTVSIKLYNTIGQLVREIYNETIQAGNYTIDLSTDGLAVGTYFIVLETPDGKMSRSLVVLR